jgi:hypothetical protein
VKNSAHNKRGITEIRAATRKGCEKNEPQLGEKQQEQEAEIPPPTPVFLF